MPKFFRNFRIKSIELSKVKNYLLYAVGEIILVVAGILIAVKVGDINEQKKKEQEFKAALAVIEGDLQADIAKVTLALEVWRRKDSISYRILEDNVTLEDLSKDPDLFNMLMRQIFSVTIHFNGYKAIVGMLENKPTGYEKVLELLSYLMDSRAFNVDKFQKDLNDFSTNFAQFQRDNQNWDWMRQTKNPRVVEKEYEFYKKDIRLKNWVSFHLKKQHALMLMLVGYREAAYELLIELQRVEHKEVTFQLLNALIKPITVSLQNCNSTRIPKLTIDIRPGNLRDFSFASTMLIKNDANDTIKGYVGTSEFSFNEFDPIAPRELKVIELPLNMNLYFFKKDSCLGFTSHAKYNQLITIE
jgi:hypothetical protein